MAFVYAPQSSPPHPDRESQGAPFLSPHRCNPPGAQEQENARLADLTSTAVDFGGVRSSSHSFSSCSLRSTIVLLSWSSPCAVCSGRRSPTFVHRGEVLGRSVNKRSRHTSLVGGYARSSLGIQLAYLYKVEGGSREQKEQAQGGSQGSAEGRVRGRVQGRPGRGVEGGAGRR
jgi:hypothetical protein